MRVLHFYRTYFPDTMGGIEQVIYQIARGTASHGIKSDVLTLTSHKTGQTIALDNHLVHRARLDFQVASTGFSLSALLRFASLANEYDVIHYHFPWPFMDIVHFASRVRKPSVVTYHSDIIRQRLLLTLYRPLMHRFLNSVDSIVATSPNYFETSPVLDVYRNKTVVIPIGLDKACYPTPTPQLLAKWKSKVGDRFFLFVGMIRYYKGLHILLDAAKGVNLPIVIMGSGPVEGELKKHAKRERLTNIHFLGALPDEDKVALLKLSFAMVFPSHLRAEAFGVSLLEGAMFGKPMISSEIGTGTSFINVHNETGLVVPPNNPSAFRDAMLYFWNNPKIASQMGARAEERYLRYFTADKMAAAYSELYRLLLVKHSS